MTNQEILNVLENLEGFKYKNVYTEEQIEKDRNSLNKLKEQLALCNVPRWVACKDKLPKEEKEYLVWNGKYSYNLFFVKKVGIFEHYDRGVDRNVTHWMPLPKPPC